MNINFTINLGFFSDMSAARSLAEERGLGIEVQHFADGPLLDGAWRAKLTEIQTALKGFKGFLSMHGPFSNMDLGGWDPQVQAVSRGRFLHALQIADQLGARIIVLHSAYDNGMRYHGGIPVWAERRVPFWGDVARVAEKMGITLVVENTHELDATAQNTLIDAVNAPSLRACLDIGHCNMTAQTPVSIWIEQLGSRLIYVHAHNNSGKYDDHWPLTKGTMDIKAVFQQFSNLKAPPRVCLELRNMDDQRTSLKFIDEQCNF
jgi:sugar phosphate isomerase/epimerase